MKTFQGLIVTNNCIIANVDNRSYQVQSSHPNYTRLREAVKNGDAEEFVSLVDVQEAIKTYVDSNNGEVKSTGIEVINGEVYHNGKLLHNTVVDAIKRLMSEGFNFSPMVNFLGNLVKNPSYRSVTELYSFLESMGLVITEDGYFLAYKTVRSDYKDKYTGTVDNTPGADNIPRKERNEVNDDCNMHCSEGYHVGALDYAGPNGWYHGSNDKVVICKVNPADVVSVPTDHSHQKLRCTWYQVVADYVAPLNEPVYSDRGEAVQPIVRHTIEPISVDEMVVGQFYIATYTDNCNVTKTRYFLVEEINYNRKTLTVELMEPEEFHNCYRTFYFHKLDNIFEWDGDLESVERYDDYEEEEEEEYDDYDGYEGYGKDEVEFPNEDDYGRPYW